MGQRHWPSSRPPSSTGQPLLFVADIAVLERYLMSLFADDIREDLDLDFLELSWTAADLAELRGIASDERVSTVLLMVGLDTTG
ncbi:hypothetical protein [Mycolicibacterium phlei]|uniref:Uncharacterized protein n=1 Tax=Mycolicibacterium phlei DSM 43239 = CCUG 21000 TaxID=1226750 RepID=A0A5N5V677_MYCPH|nr:hypothetical protein [Mycolicibacterium phlei]KAB7757432.1 hypothetical protein MPHL21000_07550 [Mycolicibacterium phlei DSM 43239 = CCUG 21000]KXW66328.1 hypothetical protein MPHL43239_08135 [Mycolicibacterium phlei DSM 43239 = CCUG 21000]KXW67689.1 hypothetical protein MPHL43070_20010 [Mycolicibacterium phlei DSM 43070]KXW70382.1 hypothetical protein MPHL43072_19765 [Mycolicibacterium phlei DSM 43072]KXW75881.1 hypothetical protein JL15_20050 [Mycolicibacterium phlei DSM 43071]